MLDCWSNLLHISLLRVQGWAQLGKAVDGKVSAQCKVRGPENTRIWFIRLKPSLLERAAPAPGELWKINAPSRCPVMRGLSPAEDGGSYATLNGAKQTVDIKIASSAGSVMSVKRSSENARHHQPNYGTAYDEPAVRERETSSGLFMSIWCLAATR